MRLGVAADHAGFVLREPIALQLQAAGHEVVDFGSTLYTTEDDYPDVVSPLAEAVACGDVDRGVAIGGSGVGACIVANKIPGVRASICHDVFSVVRGVEYDDLNLLVLGAWVVGPELAVEIARGFAATQFEGEERHVRRLVKLKELEMRYNKSIQEKVTA